ncbi:MAG: Gfo/Idh/MocA family oxidoreductase, partial [Actinomycetota bacterium]|nr:Gfo/Idh/MocA family oxidoreductase [Actinomycetota bacterium]
RALLQECAERGVHLFVAHVLRHFEQYVRAREVASSGELGRVSTVRLRRAVPTPSGAEDWFRDADASGGVVLDLLIHDIDFLIGLFGAPAHVHARRRRVAETEHVGATLRFAGGELAFLEGSWGGVSALEYGCEIAGSAGNLAFDSAPRVPLRLERLDGGSVVEQPSNRDPYREQLADFVSRRSGPPAPDTDAVLAVLVCAALDESARSGRTVSLEEVS